MTGSSQTHLLSPNARAVYYIGPPAAVLLALLISPKLAATIPATSLPTVYALYKYHTSSPTSRAHLEPCVWSYAFTITIGILTTLTSQAILGFSFLYLFHGHDTLKFLADAMKKDVSADVLAARAATAWTWQNVAQRAWTMYIAGALSEEVMKVLPIAYIRAQKQKRVDGSDSSPPESSVAIEYLQYGIASGLAYGAAEALFGAYGLVRANASWARLGREVGERIGYGSLAHVLTTTLSALRLAQGTDGTVTGQKEARSSRMRKMSLWRAILPSVLYHGTGNFALLSISAMHGNIAWKYPTDTMSLVAVYSTAVGAIGIAAVHVWWEWQRLIVAERKLR